jgi:hypothetical protein
VLSPLQQQHLQLKAVVVLCRERHQRLLLHSHNRTSHKHRMRSVLLLLGLHQEVVGVSSLQHHPVTAQRVHLHLPQQKHPQHPQLSRKRQQAGIALSSSQQLRLRLLALLSQQRQDQKRKHHLHRRGQLAHLLLRRARSSCPQVQRSHRQQQQVKGSLRQEQHPKQSPVALLRQQRPAVAVMQQQQLGRHQQKKGAAVLLQLRRHQLEERQQNQQQQRLVVARLLHRRAAQQRRHLKQAKQGESGRSLSFDWVVWHACWVACTWSVRMFVYIE